MIKFNWEIRGKSIIYGDIHLHEKFADLADPFLFEDRYVFFEHFDYRNKIGTIQYIDLASGVRRKLFNNYFHVSFPFLFRKNNKIYMLPEEHRLRKLSAYELSVDNSTGIIEIVDETLILKDVSIVDAMVVFSDKLGFILYNEDVGDIGDPGGILKMATIDSKFQVNNDRLISADVRSSRNAGTIKIINNFIYFTSQLKKPKSYGDGIFLRKINLNTFRLEHVKQCLPISSIDVHHIDWRQTSLGFVFDVKRFIN